MGPTLIEEYQTKLQDLRKDLDSKDLMVKSLQNDSESLLKSSEEDQKVMKNQSLEIEKFKRAQAKLQKENVTLQNEMRKIQKGGVNIPKRQQTQMSKNMKNMEEDFRHSFKRSLIIDKDAGNIDFMSQELEDKLQSFNSRFMETLTESLTKQLGFNISEAVETERRLTVGSSFVEKPTEQYSFGKRENLSGKKAKMTASMIVPGEQISKKPQQSQILQHAQTMKQQPIPSLATLEQQAIADTKLSVIQDCETVNEEESQAPNDENVEISDDDIKKPVSGLEKFNGQDDLLEMISRRSSILEEIRKSQIESGQQDEEMEIIEVEDEPDAPEEVPEEITQEHTQTILKLDAGLNEKEALLAAIKESQSQMQHDLIDLMKNQYQSKVLQLTTEITQLERQKSQSLGKNSITSNERKKIEEQFKAKQRDLENQLKTFKEKNKHQQNVKKQVDTQNMKIRGLESEISKIKVQKVSAQRKYKEET